MGVLQGTLGAEQTGPLRAGKEKEQFLEEGNEARGQLICEGMRLLRSLRLIMVTSGTEGPAWRDDFYTILSHRGFSPEAKGSPTWL